MSPCSKSHDAGTRSGGGVSMLAVPGNGDSSNLMKSISTPAIPSIHEQEKRKVVESLRTGAIAENMPDNTGALTGNNAAASSVAGTTEEEADEDEILNNFLANERKPRNRMSMIEFLNDPSNFDEGSQNQRRVSGGGGSGAKEEKKRRSSVFSKLGSYRQKKLVKDMKSKSTHQFMTISFSNSTICDVCSKSMDNKVALQCENCMVNVHENSCKDQIAPCAKFRSKVRDGNKDKMAKFQSSSLPGGNTTAVRSTNSFKERSRAASVPSRTFHQTSNSSGTLPRTGSPSGVNGTTMATTGYFQWRRVATKLGIDKVLEEREKDKETQDSTLHLPICSEGTNMTEVISVSIESLDEVGTADINDFEDDPDLMITPQDPEAWSVTVDKKTLKKLSAKDIKRQDHIWELIQTEKSHCRTLKIMQKIFSRGMSEELHMSQEMIDRVFPKLNDLIDIHTTFLHRLIDRQKIRADHSIDDVGDLLVGQFEGEMGGRMKQAYGEFCSRHNEAVQLYKDILKSDRKFQNFIKKCSRNNLCKRLGIPECILLVTQRMTKYPLLIEPIIKTTKDARADHALLKRALDLAREILSYVDMQIDARAKEQRLIEIFNKLDARSSAVYKGKKFKKSDLLSNNRKLVHDGTIKWMSARGRGFEVLAVILSDVIFFLSESNQKYAFFSQDNKTSVVSLSKLLVREKGDTRDSKGVYLIVQSKTDPEMYELVCKTPEHRKAWISIVRQAILRCPEEDETIDTASEEGMPLESEEEKKLLEAKSAKLRQLIDQLHQKDATVRQCCDEKLRIIIDMLEIFGREDSVSNLKSVYRDREGQELLDPEEILHAAMHEATQLTLLLTTNGNSNLSRSVSSVGEHESPSYTTPPLPKRAETFSGFEAKEKDKSLKKRYVSSANESSQSAIDYSNQSPTRQPREPEGELLNTSESNTKDRINRRMSTSFLQNLLIKQHADRSEDTESRAGSSDRGSLGELSSASSLSANSLSLTPPTREQCAALAQLIQYLHALVTISSSQSTETESFRAQLAEAHGKISILYSETERLSDKKNLYHHDKQLEELRNLQETINQERLRWDRERSKQNEHLEAKAQELKEEKDGIEKERAEMRSQREELQRQRDALQRQMDLFEHQKSHLARDHHSPSSRDHLASPVTRSASTAPSDSPKLKPRKSESPVNVKPVPTSVVPQMMWDNVVHKRSASDELAQFGGESFEPMREEYSNSLKEPLNFPPTRESRSESRSSIRGMPSSSSLSGRDPPVPIHLLSATNERKIGPVAPQQLPFKLAGSSSTSSLLKSSSMSKSHNSSGMLQKLPFKLASDKSSSAGPPSSPPMMSPPASQTSPVRSTNPATMTSPKWGEHKQRQVVAGSPVSSSPLQQQQQRLHSSRSQPHLGSVGSRFTAPPAGPSMLPMKLAERRPKSASPSPQQQRHSPALPASSSSSSSQVFTFQHPAPRPPHPNYPQHHQQQQQQQQQSPQESEVIYF